MGRDNNVHYAKRIVIALMILAVVLVLLFLSRCHAGDYSSDAYVPNNRIQAGSDASGSDADQDSSTQPTVDTSDGTAGDSTGPAGSSVSADTEKTAGTESGTGGGKQPSEGGTTTPASTAATTIDLYGKNPEENESFSLDNMFPGDSVTKSFRVLVSHDGAATLAFHAEMDPGCEAMAEVLGVRVELPDEGEVLYDGPIGDMPAQIDYSMDANSSKSHEVYYEITAYLDTSVGNEYQGQNLVVDFIWWVEGAGDGGA